MEQMIQSLKDASGVNAIILAVVLLVATTLVSRYAVRLVRKLLSSDGAPLPSSTLIENIVRIAIWGLGGSLILSMCFDVNVGGLLAALGVGGVALSLGLQDTISNFIGGLQVTLMKIVQPGDHVKIGSTEGMVLDVTWRQTMVKDFENNLHIIPNSSINSGEVEKIEPAQIVATMLSFTNDTRDIDETIRAMELAAKEAVEQVAELERDPWILLTQIGEYGTWAKMRFVLKDMDHVREARDAALRAVSPYTRMNLEDVPDGRRA
ncbi:MAG: mechanosensitive ion channel [Atopobiaceae bacterium]|nr:mechanosensitive ion channel [Atopobiaceae bacterium]MBR3312975.1 mechanosensitive ion channel [Atopobiaceae bacterium]